MAQEIKKKTVTMATEPSVNPQEAHPFFLAMDSTAIEEISFMENHQFSKEIIEDVEKVYDLKKLKLLRKKEKNKFLREGKNQIDKLWRGWQSMEAHTQMFVVTFQVRIGNLLAEIETVFRDKSKYAAWIKNNFGAEKMRYFQQARELADMGEFAFKYRALGKNRLIEFNRLRKSTKNLLRKF